MKKATVLDLVVALDEMMDKEIINQFETLTTEMIIKITERAIEVANENEV